LVIEKLSNEEITSPESQESSIGIVEILSALWHSKKLIAYVVGISTALAIIVSYLMPEYFRSTTVLLPETDKSKLSAMGGLSDLASLAGVNTGDVSLVKLYPTIITSESVLKNVIYAQYHSEKFKDSVNLIQFWEIEAKTPALVYETALKSFRDQLEVSMDNKTSVVTIAIESKEPQLSADIVNKITAELDRFIRTKRITNASEQRKWIETRLAEVKADLEKSENWLRDFREKNRRVNDSPELLLEQERLIREVQIDATLYTELKKQYELVKIEEIKNIPIINVLDPARAAAWKDKPKKVMIWVTVLFFFR
jgi:uncharacterized protein involved in exopolysaccharide biosynthesis